MSPSHAGFYHDDDAGFEAIIDALRFVGQVLEAAALQGMIDAAQVVEQDASITRLYDDETGATRQSTTAYVAGGDYNGDSIVDARRAQAQALYDQALAAGVVGRKSFAVVDEVEPAQADSSFILILTALMDYDLFLATMQGGARDFITESLVGNAGLIQQQIARKLRDVLA